MFDLFSMSLCGNSIEWLLGQDNWQLWSVVGVLIGLVVIGIVLGFAKKEVLKPYVKGSAVFFALFTVGCLITNLYMKISEGDIMKYQKFFIICGILLILSALVIAVTNMLAKGNKTAKMVAKIVGLGLLISSLGLFIAGMVSVEDLGWIDGGEIFVNLGKGGQVAITVMSMLVFVAMAIFTMIPNKKSTKTNNTLALVYGGISIAMSFALSYARIFKLPAGGSITVASLLPLALYSYMFGAKKGVMAGMIYGVLQIMQDPWIVHPAQVLLDYVLPFGMIGFTGLFRKISNKAVGMGVGVLVASIFRYLCHVCSGGLFFYCYANQIYDPWTWSFLYNSFVFVDIAIVVVMGVFLMFSKQFVKMTNDISNRYLNA